MIYDEFLRFSGNTLSLLWFWRWRRRYPFLNQQDVRNMSRLTQSILRRTDSQIFGGPFAGLKIPNESSLRRYPMFAVGSYEEELHGVLRETICNAPSLIIDIGSAGGYYSVGLAKKIQHVNVIAYEVLSDQYESEAREYASLNGVHNKIDQRGLCTKHELLDSTPPNAFIICDCEGGEIELLDPDFISNLRTCTIVCEVHDFVQDDITSQLIHRFRSSHQIELLDETSRDPSKYRILNRYSPAIRRLAVQESRHYNSRLMVGKFLVLRPINEGT